MICSLIKTRKPTLKVTGLIRASVKHDSLESKFLYSLHSALEQFTYKLDLSILINEIKPVILYICFVFVFLLSTKFHEETKTNVPNKRSSFSCLSNVC